MAINYSAAFEVPPDYEAVLDVARRVAAKLAPNYVRNDLRGEFPADVLATLGEAGLLGLNTPEEAGGEGAGELLTGMVCEELASADFLSGVLVIQSGTACKLLHSFGDPAVAAEWLPRILAGRTTIALGLTEPQSGSDLAEITTRARMDGGDWVISGQKASSCWPPHPTARACSWSREDLPGTPSPGSTIWAAGRPDAGS